MNMSMFLGIDVITNVSVDIITSVGRNMLPNVWHICSNIPFPSLPSLHRSEDQLGKGQKRNSKATSQEHIRNNFLKSNTTVNIYSKSHLNSYVCIGCMFAQNIGCSTRAQLHVRGNPRNNHITLSLNPPTPQDFDKL